MRVMIQAGILSVTQPSPEDLALTLDRTALKGAGRNAIGHFLLQLQVHKATANVEAAKKLFDYYSGVVEPWTTWRDIVLANKRPRKMFAQPNLVVENDEVQLKAYEPTCEGLIQSWVERFEDAESLYADILHLSKVDAHYFT